MDWAKYSVVYSPHWVNSDAIGDLALSLHGESIAERQFDKMAYLETTFSSDVDLGICQANVSEADSKPKP
jgi:hypothetical protein